MRANKALIAGKEYYLGEHFVQGEKFSAKVGVHATYFGLSGTGTHGVLYADIHDKIYRFQTQGRPKFASHLSSEGTHWTGVRATLEGTVTNEQEQKTIRSQLERYHLARTQPQKEVSEAQSLFH